MAIQVGAAWYRRDQFERLRRVAADPDVVEETYDDWVAMAERGMLMAVEAGMPMEKVDVDVEELIAWCIEKKRPVDGPARAEFVSRLLRARAGE